MTTKRVFSVTLFFLALEVIFLFIKHVPDNPPTVLDYWICGTVAVVIFYGLMGLVLSFIRHTTTQRDAIYKGILLSLFTLNVIFMYAVFYRRFGLIDGETNLLVRRSRDFLYFS